MGVGLGLGGAAGAQEAFVGLDAQLLALAVLERGQVGGAFEVGGRLAVAERDRGIARAEEGGIFRADAAVAARRDVDVAGQGIVGGAEQLGADGAEVRISHGGLAAAAGVHDVVAAAVVVVGGVDAADQGHAVHLRGGVRQQLADVNAGHRGGDGLEGTAGIGAGFGVPRFQLAGPAQQQDDKDPFLSRVQLARGERLDERAETEGPAHPRSRPPKNCRRDNVCSAEPQE